MTFAALLQGVRAGVTFQPGGVNDLILDLDGDRGLTTSNVNKLWDATPNAHTATQDTSASRPSLIQNDPDFNGRASLSFDGVNDFLTAANSADFELGTGLTIYMAMTAVAPVATKYLLTKRASLVTEMSWQVVLNISGTASFVTRNSANTANHTAVGASVVVDGAVHMVRARHDSGVDTAIRVDSGSEIATPSPNSVASSVGTLNIVSFTTSGVGLPAAKVARILIYKESIPSGSVADLAIMAELDAVYKGVGTPTGLLFEGEGNLVADFNPEVNAGLATTIWADQSVGVAHNATQATAAQQPAYAASDAAFNGHGSLASDGLPWMTIAHHAELNAANGLTIVGVASATTAAGWRTLISKQAAGSREWWVGWPGTTSGLGVSVRNAADTANSDLYPSWGASQVDGVPRIWEAVIDPGSALLTLRVEGVEHTAPIVGGVLTSTYLVGVGNIPNGLNINIGSEARFLIYNRALSASERTRVRDYIKARYHIGYSGFSLGYSNGFG